MGKHHLAIRKHTMLGAYTAESEEPTQKVTKGTGCVGIPDMLFNIIYIMRTHRYSTQGVSKVHFNPQL